MMFFTYLAMGLVFLVVPALAMRRWRPKARRLPAAALPARASTLAEVRPGDRVAVFGRVATTDQKLLAPLTRQPCVIFTIQQYRERERGVQAQAFVIEDEHGTAFVDPANADIRLWPTPQYRPALDGPSFVGSLSHGQLVLVIGTVRVMESVDGAAYRVASVVPRIAIVGTADQPLIISDRVDDHNAVPRAKEPW